MKALLGAGVVSGTVAGSVDNTAQDMKAIVEEGKSCMAAEHHSEDRTSALEASGLAVELALDNLALVPFVEMVDCMVECSQAVAFDRYFACTGYNNPSARLIGRKW